MKFFRHLFFCCLIFSASALPAEERQKPAISEDRWLEMKGDEEYLETFKDKKKEEQKEKEEKEKEQSGVVESKGTQLGNWKYVIYLAVIALVTFFVIRIFGNFKDNEVVPEKKPEIEDLEEVEEKMHELDLEQLLQQAVQARNYRVALRLNFLIIIKQLSQSGKIAWAREKTNWEYHSELKNRLLADQFREIILSFESFWYGEHPLTELEYHRSEPGYQALRQKLMHEQ